MPRTSEQTAADEALTEAILNVKRAYLDDNWSGVLTEYVVVLAERCFDDDGDAEDGVSILSMNGDQPLHRTLGLLDYALALQRLGIGQQDDD